MTQHEFTNFCYNQHDVVCNQKYAKTLPYSFHLKAVKSQVNYFKHLLNLGDIDLAQMGADGHDLIEDCRITYNELLNMIGKEVADIIFACTELRGRSRDERHGQLYYDTLKESRLGTFVKLCDIIANAKMGLLENSNMYYKYQKEFHHVKEQLYREEFKEMFDYMEKIYSIN